MPAGYSSDNLECGPTAYITLGNGRSINESITNVYAQLMACDDVQIICNVLNNTGNCDMEYFDLNEVSLDFDFIDMFNCNDPLPVSSFLGARCIGTCPQSPTESPTQAPPFSPTAITMDPTPAPTLNPSKAPTLAPSISPSSAPTNAPSISPSTAPSMTPSSTPTLSPSVAPSNAPTSSPSPAPSAGPTNFPTMPPSPAPTSAPINNPTFSPSLAPSFSPSQSPTNNPIASGDFDHYISVTYVLENVNDFVKTSVTTNPMNETNYIEWVIKSNYFLQKFLPYQKYKVSILDIEGTEVTEIDGNAYAQWLGLNELHLNAEIECNEATDDDNANYCAQVQIQSKKNNDFDERVTAALKSHYQHDSLIFTIQNGDELQIECKDCEEDPPNYVLYGLATVVGLIYIIAFFALLFNMGKFPKLPGFHYVDNGNWVALMTIGLQFWFVYMHLIIIITIHNKHNI